MNYLVLLLFIVASVYGQSKFSINKPLCQKLPSLPSGVYKISYRRVSYPKIDQNPKIYRTGSTISFSCSQGAGAAKCGSDGSWALSGPCSGGASSGGGSVRAMMVPSQPRQSSCSCPCGGGGGGGAGAGRSMMQVSGGSNSNSGNLVPGKMYRVVFNGRVCLMKFNGYSGGSATQAKSDETTTISETTETPSDLGEDDASKSTGGGTGPTTESQTGSTLAESTPTTLFDSS
ncbi:hypothetical protein SNEBB_008626 [Seison nebaliae]|nr:hypothetical protein SNEBB_008626 [Seison nebaliae]